MYGIRTPEAGSLDVLGRTYKSLALYNERFPSDLKPFKNRLHPTSLAAKSNCHLSQKISPSSAEQAGTEGTRIVKWFTSNTYDLTSIPT